MYISNFVEEEILESNNLVLSSLFILVFVFPSSTTYLDVQGHRQKEVLSGMLKNENLKDYFFLSLVNPIGFNFVTKNLPQPHLRSGINNDFLLVDTNELYDFMQVINVMSSTFALN